MEVLEGDEPCLDTRPLGCGGLVGRERDLDGRVVDSLAGSHVRIESLFISMTLSTAACIVCIQRSFTCANVAASGGHAHGILMGAPLGPLTAPSQSPVPDNNMSFTFLALIGSEQAYR